MPYSRGSYAEPHVKEQRRNWRVSPELWFADFRDLRRHTTESGQRDEHEDRA